MNGKKSSFIFIIIGFAVLYILTTVVLLRTNSIKSNDYRGQLDSVREQLATAERTNRELEEQLESANSRLEQISFLCEELGESTGRNITTVRQCIEIISEIREEIGEMGIILGLFDSDGYYNWLDSYVFDSEVLNEKN